jgi:hypothetical protein
VLDKRQRALSLPRLGIRLRADEICGFIEVHAWHTEGDRGEYSHEWVGEVTVLAADEDGAITRLPVLTCQRPAQVGRLAAALAEFFGAERRLLKEGWMAHRRRRAAGRAGA